MVNIFYDLAKKPCPSCGKQEVIAKNVFSCKTCDKLIVSKEKFCNSCEYIIQGKHDLDQHKPVDLK